MPGAATVLHIFLSLSVVSLFVDLIINPFVPNPSLSAAESESVRFDVKIPSLSTLPLEPEKKVHRVPN